MSRQLKKIILYGLAGTVIFTALAHGAVETWSLAVFESMVVFLTLLWGIRAVTNKAITLHIPRVVFPVAGLLVWGLLQSVVYTDQAGQRHSLSMDVEATRETITTLFVFLLALLLAANLLSRREELAKLPLLVAGYGLALALFGLIQYFSWDGRFFWWRQTTDLVTSPFGPFVAHNHFAGYMELLLPIPIAFIIMRIGQIEARMFYGFAAAVMGGSLVASLSRGGIISLLTQLIFFAAATPFLSSRSYHAQRRFSRPHLVRVFTPLLAVFLITVAIGASVYWIGLEPVINRLSQGKLVMAEAKEETFLMSRGWIWRDTLAMIQAYPLTGVGLGAFETVFPIYSQSDGSLQIGQAHNDYLQLIAETGIIGTILLLWFLGLVLHQVLRGMQIRDPLRAALSLGMGGSLVGIMVHSVFDFNLQLPSHALLLALLTGVLARIQVSEVNSATMFVMDGVAEKAFAETVGS